MKRRAFARAAAVGYRVQLGALPARQRFAKVRYLGRTTIRLDRRLCASALTRALLDATAAPLPTDRRCALVTG